MNDKGEEAVSDEAYRAVLSAYDSAIIDDTTAPTFTSPAEDEVFDHASPPTFTWSLPESSLRRHHGPPTTGEVFLVEILGTKADCAPAFFTSGTSWEISSDTWNIVVASDVNLSARVTYAYASENVILKGDGPFRASQDRNFQIAP